MAPILDKLALEFGGQIELVKVDADKPENEELLRQYDVRSIPTLVLLSDQGDVLGKMIGAKSYTELSTWLNTIISVKH